ncbi:MAG TPA: hypothetical protein ENO22_08210 [candidate division Zixibacteria bacterium]|nr:hypothetical protein [candidate division Zixibacteria bacterium]HEQ99305.1 hypothetical protein [candidate division Zixibacteria bacterium]
MFKHKLIIVVSAFLLAAGLSATGSAQVGPPAPDAIWADDVLYSTVGTPTSLPDHGPKDSLFVFQNLGGQVPVSESKPGDTDYNGGRWQVILLSFTPEGLGVHDPDNDGESDLILTSWEQVKQHIDLGHLVRDGLGDSFVCPLKKQ